MWLAYVPFWDSQVWLIFVPEQLIVACIHPRATNCGSYPSQGNQLWLVSIPEQPSVAHIPPGTAKCSLHLSQDSQVQLTFVRAKCSSHLSEPSAAHICPRTAMCGWHMAHSGTVRCSSHPSWDSQLSGREIFACVNSPSVSLFLS